MALVLNVIIYRGTYTDSVLVCTSVYLLHQEFVNFYRCAYPS
jgi:hypothetical protein